MQKILLLYKFYALLLQQLSLSYTYKSFSGSYTSTVFREETPSYPPHTYSFLFKATAPSALQKKNVLISVHVQTSTTVG